MAVVASKSALVRPAFTATAAACMISGLSGPIMCTPTILSFAAGDALYMPYAGEEKASALVHEAALRNWEGDGTNYMAS